MIHLNTRRNLCRWAMLTCFYAAHAAIEAATILPTTPLFHAQHPLHDDSLQTAVVVGQQRIVTRNTVSQKITAQTIDQALGQQFCDLLENISGVSSIKTGTTVGKPVIHGMYGSRILLLNNGVRQTGQQWGLEHAPEVDMHTAEEVNVVKGSDAVRYGSDAMGGVIIMQQKRLPYQQKGIHGKTILSGNTNGWQYNALTQVEGAFSFLPRLAWRWQGSYANSGDQRTAHYLLNNSGTRQYNMSASIGYQLPHIHLKTFYQLYNTHMGVMWSAKMGSKDLLEQRIQMGKPLYVTPYTRHIQFPKRHVTHHTLSFEAQWDNPYWGKWKWQTAYQKDIRCEYNIRRLNHSDIPAVALHLSSLQHRISGTKHWDNWQGEWGAQSLYTNNYSRKGTGIQPILPNYVETQIGTYAIVKHHFSRGGVETGLRFDYQRTNSKGYDAYNNNYGGLRQFRNFSYHIGAHTHIIPRLTLTTNYALAWRAPHVFELYSNGHEAGSGMYIKGDSLMNSEKSHKWVLGLNYATPHLHCSLDGYLQWVDGYIFDSPTNREIATIAGVYPLFQYQQTATWIRGIDLDIQWKPTPQWTYQATAAQIWANERHTHQYLPYIPSFRLHHSLTWTHEYHRHQMLNINVGHRFVAKQTRFSPQRDLIDFTPPAYHLVDCSISLKWPLHHRQSLSATIAADNLLNKEYKEYTNRSRYYAHDLGRSLRAILTFRF